MLLMTMANLVPRLDRSFPRKEPSRKKKHPANKNVHCKLSEIRLYDIGLISPRLQIVNWLFFVEM
ncbi:MAG: hypothetical protein VR72_18990 [Clostridiaceae bacterium BRH_c20a]|nr:MAG: hypothetical protein VR72_18990 [Clostridiaceae bacterium BRH_c20a]